MVYYLFLMFFCIIMSRLMVMSTMKHNVKAYRCEELIIMIIILSVYTFIVGFRYNVGSDWISDYESYLRLETFGIYDKSDYDVGYYLLNAFSAYFGLGFYFVLCVVALITFFFVIKSVGNAKFLLPFYLFFFFCVIFNESLNVMRQVLACFGCIWAFSLLLSKKIKWSITVFIISWSFHRTSLFALTYIPFLFFNPFKNRNLNIVVILLSFVFGEILYGYFKDFIIGISLFSSGSRASETITEYGFQVFEAQAVDWNAQMVKYVYLFVNLLIVWYSPQIKENFEKYHFSFYFSLFMVGQILQPVLIYHSMFQRLNYYYYLYCILMLSYLCYSLWNIRFSKTGMITQRMTTVTVLLIYLLIHIRHILQYDSLMYKNYFLDVVL